MAESPVTLRYQGEIATTFLDVGDVEPGGTFTVPADEAERYTRRADVVEASPPVVPATVAPTPPPEPAATPVTS